MWVPEAQVFQDLADDGGVVDDGNDAHRATAFGTGQWVEFEEKFALSSAFAASLYANWLSRCD
jgi:hypothetical protein